jgi:hypothetical protein
VTDLAVSEPGADPNPAPTHQVVPGDEVRELVARKERDLEALRLELRAALQEAAEAERRLAERPDAPVPVPAPAEEATTATSTTAPTTPAPRTTVVTRLPVATPDARPASDGSPAHRRSRSATAADPELGWLRFLGSHVIVKLGITLTVLALLLLFFA